MTCKSAAKISTHPAAGRFRSNETLKLTSNTGFLFFITGSPSSQREQGGLDVRKSTLGLKRRAPEADQGEFG
jgi:hypothetical protein